MTSNLSKLEIVIYKQHPGYISMILLAVMQACLLALCSAEISQIRPSARVETNTGVSDKAFETKFQEMLISCRKLEMSFTNSTKFSMFSWRILALLASGLYSAIVRFPCTIRIGIGGQ